MTDIVKRTAKIMHHAFERLIIKGINRKIATGKILLDITPDIIAHNHAIFIGSIGITGRWSTKRRHFYQFTSRIHMRQLKAATDDTATFTEHVFNFVRFGISDRIEIFGFQPQ